MNFFKHFVKTKEEKRYDIILKEEYIPIINKIDYFEQDELKSFNKTASWLFKGRDDIYEFEKMIREKWGILKIIFQASENTLRGVLFYSPEELSFRKHLSRKEVDVWIYKVSLALIAYSSLPGKIQVDTPENVMINDLIRDNWSKYIDGVLKSFNEIYKKNISRNNLEYYIKGLKEDLKQGYSTSMNLKKVNEMMVRDFIVIGRELLQEIWKEKISEKDLQENIPYIKDSNSLSPPVRKIYFLGAKIWQEHKQKVQPFIAKLD